MSTLNHPSDQATAAAQTATDASPNVLFIERLVRSLLPHYLSITDDVAAARLDIIETLASYGCRTRAELLNAARIMASSFSALEALAEAAAPDMSHSLKLRYRGCANTLNRHCQKDEAALAKRLSLDPPGEIPAAEPADSRADEADVADITRIHLEVEAAREAAHAARAQHAHPPAPASHSGPRTAGPEPEAPSADDSSGENPPWINEVIAQFEQSIAEPSAMIHSS